MLIEISLLGPSAQGRPSPTLIKTGGTPMAGGLGVFPTILGHAQRIGCVPLFMLIEISLLGPSAQGRPSPTLIKTGGTPMAGGWGYSPQFWNTPSA